MTSKLITFLVDGFTSGMKSHLMAYLLGGNAHIHIGFETLKVKCTQYGICSQAAFKNARAIFILFSGGTDICFRAGLKKSGRGQKFRGEGYPPPGSDTLKVRRGYFNVPRDTPHADTWCNARVWVDFFSGLL